MKLKDQGVNNKDFPNPLLLILFNFNKQLILRIEFIQ